MEESVNMEGVEPPLQSNFVSSDLYVVEALPQKSKEGKWYLQSDCILL